MANNKVHPASIHNGFPTGSRLCGWQRKENGESNNNNEHVLRWLPGNIRRSVPKK